MHFAGKNAAENGPPFGIFLGQKACSRHFPPLKFFPEFHGPDAYHATSDHLLEPAARRRRRLRSVGLSWWFWRC